MRGSVAACCQRRSVDTRQRMRGVHVTCGAPARAPTRLEHPDDHVMRAQPAGVARRAAASDAHDSQAGNAARQRRRVDVHTPAVACCPVQHGGRRLCAVLAAHHGLHNVDESATRRQSVIGVAAQARVPPETNNVGRHGTVAT